MRVISVLVAVSLALLLLTSCNCCDTCQKDKAACASCSGTCASCATDDAAKCEACSGAMAGKTGWCAACKKGFYEGQEVGCTESCAANPGGPPCQNCVK